MNPLEFLSEFIIQAGENNLKTLEYPREFENLKMKVSFGMGMVEFRPGNETSLTYIRADGIHKAALAQDC